MIGSNEASHRLRYLRNAWLVHHRSSPGLKSTCSSDATNHLVAITSRASLADAHGRIAQQHVVLRVIALEPAADEIAVVQAASPAVRSAKSR